MKRNHNILVIGTGLAGLSFALKAAHIGEVSIISKGTLSDSNTQMAQGGVAAVISETDSISKHIEDTLIAGAGCCDPLAVKNIVEQGPERIQDLVNWGVRFDKTNKEDFSLTREGCHSERRILHVQDHTGRAIHSTLLKKCKQHPNIHFYENQFLIDLITRKSVDPAYINKDECLGAYILDNSTQTVHTVTSNYTILATGGAGKVYLYTSNWSGATGDGIAAAHRAGARISHLEFMQFHPTCLYHPNSRNFLISEALRGEGGILINKDGVSFMEQHHPLGSLAPRDIVARSIDAEIKKTGADCVYLDMTHHSSEYLKQRFPDIFQKCHSLGLNISTTPIPVVPAAHYLCGGVITNTNGETDVERLFVIGESAYTGLHGANRLASNSLLECLGMAHNAANFLKINFTSTSYCNQLPAWPQNTDINSDELIVVSYMWEEIRRLMWSYVGIVRSNRRLERAQHRLQNIQKEIKEYYSNFIPHSDIEELRNIALVAELTVNCALERKESIGIHYNLDYPKTTLPKSNELKNARNENRI